jgi:hypothetical protein
MGTFRVVFRQSERDFETEDMELSHGSDEWGLFRPSKIAKLSCLAAYLAVLDSIWLVHGVADHLLCQKSTETPIPQPLSVVFL